MYDEAKEKKEQMDDFRVEVRNIIIIIFVVSVVIVIREQVIKQFGRTIKSTFLNIRCKEFVP